MQDDESYIIRKHKFISAVCTVFVTYPSVMWIPWNLDRLKAGEDVGFWGFFIFRIIYFYVLFFLQLRFNFNSISNVSFIRRFGNNLLFTFVGCTLFVGLSYGLPLLGVQTGYVGNILLFQFFVVCLLCTFIGYITALDLEQRMKEHEIELLKIENLQSRCAALANQINPHFFFNSLGGISSLVRRGDEDTTLEYVSQLSDIFRYILQSDKKQVVSLSEEIRFVEAFIHVMQVRFGGKLTFNMDIDKNSMGARLPVLSLLPLLENVTTHNRIDSDHKMTVDVYVADGYLVVSNPIFPKISHATTNGTGLDNLQHRFRLLTGKVMEVCETNNLFTVRLPL